MNSRDYAPHASIISVPLRRSITALVLTLALISPAVSALAGTTGGLTVTVFDAGTSAPVAGAQVTVSSPSQAANGTTDAAGRFSFLTLVPDTYTVAVSMKGYEGTSDPGQVVTADSVQGVSVRLNKALQTIAHVSSVARPGRLFDLGPQPTCTP